MRRQHAFWILAVLFVLIGVTLPRDWYDALPRPPQLPPPPVKGVILLQLSFVLEGLAFLWLAVRRWTFVRIPEAARLPTAAAEPEDLSARAASWGIAVITGVGLFLRLRHLGSDLWIDEITPILFYGKFSALQVIATYLSSNNHLLNTLLVKLSIAIFGETEWAIRLPAVLFGTATIPCMYWVSRFALSRRASLAAALLLAVSYHHIFYSQNARGYSFYLFFSLLSSGLLIRGLREDRLSIWMLYIVTMFLDFASLLNSVYVFAAHAIVGATALFLVGRHHQSPLPLLRRLVGVLTAVGLLVFQLYATMLPQAYVVLRSTYSTPWSGYHPFSEDFLKEMLRGISSGFGAGILFAALPFFLVAGAGFAILLRRHWMLTLTLTLPEILTAVVLLAKGLTFSPRFFLLALPVAILAAVQGVFAMSELLGSRISRTNRVASASITTLLVVALSVASLVSLRHYYATPKQAYRAALEYLQAERGSGIIIVSFLAGPGFEYYGERFGLRAGRDYVVIRSIEAFDDVLAAHRGSRSFFVTTLLRFQHLVLPELDTRIAKEWIRVRTFPGTIGGGDITIWEQR